MKIVQFKLKDDCLNDIRIGLLKGNEVIDVNASLENVPNSLVEFLYDEDALTKLEQAWKSPKKIHNYSSVKLISPITKPDKILGLGCNYKGDCDKRNVPYPKEPIVFNKFPSLITGPYDDIVKPTASNAVDWEVELVVVIGKTARRVRSQDAFDYVLGYTATQDLTAKDWIGRSGGQLIMCKSPDGFCPLGPCLVTKDELPDPYDLKLKTWVNGELKQDGSSEEMIHRIDKVIEFLTSVITLLPGDMILTGTPFGVGASQIPSQFIQKGDIVETEVQGIGRMKHRFV